MLRLSPRVTLLTMVLLLAAAACGGTESSASEGEIATLETTDASADAAATDTAEDGDATMDTEMAVLEFTACLRDEGLDVSDPTVNSDGSVNLQSLFNQGTLDPNDDSLAAAFEECGDLLEGATALGGGQDFDQTEFQDEMVQVAACLRDAGYDVDDPDLGGFGPGNGGGGPGGGGGFFGDSFDTSDPDNQDALSTCMDEVGVGFPGGGN